MTIVVLSETPHMTEGQYEQVAADLGLSDGLPEGCHAYIAGMGPDGSTWQDLMVWDTGAQAKEFMDTMLRPAMERHGARPIWGPPTNWEAHQMFMRRT